MFRTPFHTSKRKWMISENPFKLTNNINEKCMLIKCYFLFVVKHANLRSVSERRFFMFKVNKLYFPNTKSLLLFYRHHYWELREFPELELWPVDNYQSEGVRKTTFLTENVVKYHRTISTYINDLIGAGFSIRVIKEPVPTDEILKSVPDMKDEIRRPMFLIISAEKDKTS
jgi:hypothetical protein